MEEGKREKIKERKRIIFKENEEKGEKELGRKWEKG